jgi:hypothetical protein
MNNTEQMVSVPRELLERALSATVLARGHGSPTELGLRAFLALPAAQHQGEPVCRVLDSLGTIQWSKSPPPAETKLYTHADPGEVERLRELLSEVLSEVPHGWGASFSESELAERIRNALEAQ